MALQGDLNSFALPDVLRLLAGTGKSGRLEVLGTATTGELLLREGTISSASTTSAPHAAGPSDVVFDLLRLDGGTFSFEEGDVTDKGIHVEIEATIVEAEALIAEWAEIEVIVPSMDAWVAMTPDLAGDEITISAPLWQALAAIGGGGNVHDLAAALELTDLAASRRVMELVEAQMVRIRPTHGYTPPAVALDDFEQFEQFEQFDQELGDSMTEFQDLVTEDRPVVMEDSDDALLPEPLPGEGVAYEGEAITGSVDGRAFDAMDSVDSVDSFDGGGSADDAFKAFESLAAFEQAAAMSDRIGEPGTIEGFGGADPFPPSAPAGGYGAATSDEVIAAVSAPVTEVAAAAAEPPAAPVDDERDSLLKFLSSVKP